MLLFVLVFHLFGLSNVQLMSVRRDSFDFFPKRRTKKKRKNERSTKNKKKTYIYIIIPIIQKKLEIHGEQAL